jgi:ribosomal protein S27E
MAIKCPKCGSEQVAGGRQGFAAGKAAVGTVLLGPVGLAAGLFGKKKVMVGCLACGHSWQAGKA